MRRPELYSTGQYIAWYARHTPEATAIVEHRSHVTYRTLAADLVRCLLALKAFGIRPGMLVGVETPDRYPHLLLLLACELAGATAISLTPGDLSGTDTIVRYCDVVLAGGMAPAASKTIIIPADFLAGLAPLAAGEQHRRLLDRDIARDQIARIVRTSGTTGRPKAMPMPHATQQLRVIRTMERVTGHIFGSPRLLCLYGLAVGAIYVRVLGVLQHGGTVLFAMGEHVHGLIAAGAVNYAVFSLGDIERTIERAVPPAPGRGLHVEVFGAAVPPDLRRRIARRLNASVTSKYSSNETNPVAVMDDGDVGTVCPGVEVRIVDAAGREVPGGEAGRIRVRGDTMVQGYFNDHAMTAAAFIDGWFQTGDVGFMPEPGRLVVLGRADDLLNIGGVKVAPSPIEARMKQIAGITDAVVMSVAAANAVGILLAAVEIDAERAPVRAMQQIGAMLSQYVSRFVIMPVRLLPRTDAGKVKRREIEATFHRTPDAGLIAVG